MKLILKDYIVLIAVIASVADFFTNLSPALSQNYQGLADALRLCLSTPPNAAIYRGQVCDRAFQMEAAICPSQGRTNQGCANVYNQLQANPPKMPYPYNQHQAPSSPECQQISTPQQFEYCLQQVR